MAALDSAASLWHPEEEESPREAADRASLCHAQAIGHTVDPSHGTGGVEKTPCNHRSQWKFSSSLKSRKRRLLATDPQLGQGC